MRTAATYKRYDKIYVRATPLSSPPIAAQSRHKVACAIWREARHGDDGLMAEGGRGAWRLRPFHEQ